MSIDSYDGNRQEQAEYARLVDDVCFRAVAEASSDAIVSADNGGDIIYFNPAAERTFGYASEEVLHRALTMLMPERYHAAHRQGLERFLAGGAGRVIGKTVELAGLRKDGEEFPLELSLSTWKIGEKVFFTGILRDIRRRRQNELQIEQLNRRLVLRAAELEGANKELAAFSYSVSHDLRTPLRAIDGFSQILLANYREILDAAGQDYLDRVRGAAQRMGQLIDGQLTLAAVSRTELSRKAVDLSALVEHIANDLRKREPQRLVEFVVTPGLTAQADPRMLRIVLNNLIENAWKFARQRHPARIEFGLKHDHDRHVYFVNDNGVGFDMAYVDKLFTPFQQLHGTREFEGTGIGLASVQRVIRKHGGQVWAEGETGRGATFYFTLGET